MTFTSLVSLVRSTRRWRAVALVAPLLAVLLVTGCLASQSTSEDLSVSNGSDGDFVIYLVVEDGSLARSQAWWLEEAPELDIDVQSGLPAWEAIVLKNDVVLDRVPVMGDEDRAFVLWRSTDAGTRGAPGDQFEVLVVDNESSRTIASYQLQIQA